MAEEEPLPPLAERPELDRISNAFPAPDTFLEDDTSEKLTGPRVVQFAYVAGTKEEMKNIRHDTSCYGPQSPRLWKPFGGPNGKEVTLLVEAIYDEGYEFLDVVEQDNLINALQGAKLNNRISVVIADPWSIKIERYIKYDHRINIR